MSTPYDPNTGQQQNADPAAPTQFVPAAQAPQVPQQGGFAAPSQGPADAAPAAFGAPPAFGAPAPAPGPIDNAPQFGQAPQQYGQAPQYGAAPQYGQQPQAQPGAPAWGQNGTQPMPNQPDPNAAYPNQGGYPNPGAYPNANANYGYGTPAPEPKGRRAAAGVFGMLFGTRLGRALIGLIIVGGIAAYHYATADPAQRNANGQVTQSGTVQATALQVGDCFDAPSGDSDITAVKAIPCTQAHDSQVYAEPLITETTFPGSATLTAEAKTDCGSSSTQASISSDTPSTVGLLSYTPQDADTFATQDYIICSINASSATLTQSYVSNASSAS